MERCRTSRGSRGDRGGFGAAQGQTGVDDLNPALPQGPQTMGIMVYSSTVGCDSDGLWGLGPEGLRAFFAQGFGV